MKEKIKEYKEILIAVGGAIALTALAGYGMKSEYHRGFQNGCDCMYGRMIKEFPDINFNEFYKKYHK